MRCKVWLTQGELSPQNLFRLLTSEKQSAESLQKVIAIVAAIATSFTLNMLVDHNAKLWISGCMMSFLNIKSLRKNAIF